MENPEITAVKSCQKGNLEQFAFLYDSYVNKIYRFIYYKTQHTETAEDLTSLTFTKALEKIRTFEAQKGTVQAWLYQIARHTVIDFYRSQKEPHKNIEDVWDATDDHDLLRDLEARHRLEQVDQYLKKLRPELREIFILKIWEGYTYREISSITGKTEASLKMALSRILSALKKEMPLNLFISLFFISNKF